jgi:hypothetical protein
MPSLRPPAAAIAIVAGGALLAASNTPDRQVLKRHFERDSGRYQYVPIEVPEATRRLTVEYRYDRAEGANAIDLGLFEPGPLDLVTARERGWSGSERSSVTVAPSFATPGYWPGPLPAGQWNVQLGLYKVAPGGVDVTVMVETLRDPATRCEAPSPPPPQAISGTGPRWYAGGLHLHTVHSDGTVTAAELAGRARAAGLDFVAITDHNNTAHQVETFDPGPPLRIVGEEVTTPAGHANVWGLGPGDWIDFRALPGDGAIERIVQFVRDRGAVFSINHPTVSCAGCAWEHTVPDGVAGIEIWNRATGPQDDAIAIWDGLLRQGRRITGVGASDWHGPPAPIASACVRVYAQELSVPAILDGLRQGRVIVVRDPKAPHVMFLAHADGRGFAKVGDTLEVRRGDTLDFELVVDKLPGARVELRWNGEPAGSASLSAETGAGFSRPAAPGYARVHIFDADGSTVAVTNPIYVTVR